MKYLFGGAFTLFMFWLIIIAPIFGFHYVTAQGEHTGYVTAVQTSGLFFKTHSAYIKTDTQSSQEDEYCVVGDEVFDKLKGLQEAKEKVTVQYLEWFADGVAYCGVEPAGVITGVK